MLFRGPMFARSNARSEKTGSRKKNRPLKKQIALVNERDKTNRESTSLSIYRAPLRSFTRIVQRVSYYWRGKRRKERKGKERKGKLDALSFAIIRFFFFLF